MPENAVGFEVLPPARYFRFGPFELDSRAGELRKHEIKIRIKHQAFQILLVLLKHPGEVVLREEIRQKLWPHDTVVEFDHSINASIQKLRDALGETADRPRYIETLPRRGYRFIGTVEAIPGEIPGVPKLAAVAETGESPAVLEGRTRDRRAWYIAASVLIVLLGALVFARWLRPSAARSRVGNWTLSLGPVGTAIVSPDGSAVIYRTSHGLVLRGMDSLKEIPVHTSERLVDWPIWSPNSSQVLFRTLAGLTRLPLPNGPPLVIWPKPGNTRGFAWAPDGTILAAVLGKPDGGELDLINTSAGEPARLDVPGFTDGRFFYPEFFPDGRNFLFAWAAFGEQEVGLYLATLNNGKIARGPILLRKNLTAGRYSPSGGGRLLYVQNDRLYAEKLNVGSGALEGEPERVVDGVFSEVMMHRAHFSVSRNGVLVWREGRAALAQLTWFDRTGRVLGTAGPPCLPTVVRLSPDEKHVLMYTLADGAGYSIVEPNRIGHVALPKLDRAPVWMPGSSHILYARKECGTYRILERAAAGARKRNWLEFRR
jgi:DNA-binding winged helix-turn-helix (wHTH) protein